MSFGKKPKPPKVKPAPPVPDRSDAQTTNLAAIQRKRLRGSLGIRETSFTGGLGVPTSSNSVVSALLGGT